MNCKTKEQPVKNEVIQLSDLLNMSSGEAIEWIIDNSDNFIIIQKPELVDCAEDISVKGEEILCFDGQDWHVDFVEHDSETGVDYMANGTDVISWLPLPERRLF